MLTSGEKQTGPVARGAPPARVPRGRHTSKGRGPCRRTEERGGRCVLSSGRLDRGPTGLGAGATGNGTLIAGSRREVAGSSEGCWTPSSSPCAPSAGSAPRHSARAPAPPNGLGCRGGRTAAPHSRTPSPGCSRRFGWSRPCSAGSLSSAKPAAPCSSCSSALWCWPPASTCGQGPLSTRPHVPVPGTPGGLWAGSVPPLTSGHAAEGATVSAASVNRTA